MIAQVARSTQNPQLHITYGELETYYSDTHSGIFRLVSHPDSLSGQPLRVGPIPIGTFYAGAGYGAQFPPPPDAQAILIYIDAERTLPVCGMFLFNPTVDVPPYPDGKTAGIKDRHGSELKLTDGGVSLTDGSGGARIVGGGYASVVAPHVELGAESLAAVGNAVMIQQSTQIALNAMAANINIAIATLCARLQSGSGVPIVTVTAPTAQGSSVVKAQA